MSYNSYSNNGINLTQQQFKTSKSTDSFNGMITPGQHRSYQSNFIYKGWILMLQDDSTVDNIKWLPKFLVVNKLDKNALLYDQEEMASLTNSNDNVVRIDNAIKKETFINQWRNKSEKFDAIYSNNKFLNENNTTQQFQHHLSNKDIESLDKESLNSYSTNNENESNASNNTTQTVSATPSNSTFRFAGLFFKKDKSEKLKHSTLKRAKSGIQLERKKQSLLSNNNANETMLSDSNSKQLTISKTTRSSNDYENNKSSLPTQMRPSRSHESLSSPMKQPSASFFSNKKNNEQNKSKQINQTPSSVLNRQSIKQSKRIDNIIKLNLSQESSDERSTNRTDSPVSISTIHTSLFNEENCFELKCLYSTISVFKNNQKAMNVDSEDDNQIRYDSCDLEDEEFDVIGGSSNELDSVNERRTSQYSKLIQREQPVKCYNSSELYSSRYFMCRSSDEREKWIHCFRNVTHPNLINERHCENSLQVWLLEAKGQAISSKSTKKYFCEILLSNLVNARTCSKLKKDILFWGENFDFSVTNCNYVRVELYQETTETINSKKKSKKEKDSNHLAKDTNLRSSSFIHSHSPSHTLLGYVNIPVNSIENSQPVEKWYRLESPSSSDQSSTTENRSVNGVLMDPSSTSSNSSTNAAISNSASIGSLTTTQNFSKDSISIRIKAKYQCVDILPLHCYTNLIQFIREKYLELMVDLEPYLNVRLKDDLANSLVRITHKLQIQTKFLTDLVLAEILNLEDSSLTFRGNSLATKSMESYMKLVGENYLKQTLSDCVRSIIETTHDMEIDPSKVSNQSSLQANREELVQILHLVCGRVFNSCVNFPTEIKHVFACLRSELRKHGKTDEMCDTLISASIFLRLICPAILSPNLFNLTQEYPQEKAARKLTLVAKTLQTIANFSKFGGKESYMSFDKMNHFVEEHTCLMREFLRNISTYQETDDFNSNILPIITLTPQTPNMSPTKQTRPSIEVTDYDALSDQQKLRFNKHFDLDLIDLGKQLSILHSLLTSIINTLDDPTKAKFSNELIRILDDLNNMKLKNSFEILSLKHENEMQPTNKLYSYENRLHKAILKNQQFSQVPTLTSSITCEITSFTSSQPDLTKENSITHYSSQYNLDNSSLSNINNIEQAKKLESEINLLKLKLRETEISLKKEQNEKFLIESKLKQQQHNNDQQMREIINRLIKVEEELRKEQLEMHKVLKAKQELIEIQKKRIEYLSNRSNSSNSINKSINQQQAQQKHHISSLNHSLIANYNNKLKQFNNKKSQNNSNEQTLTNQNIPNNGITTALNSALPAISTSPVTSLSISTTAKLNENISAQIAASPSSSSSSMTQFCNYLATNSLNNSNNFSLKKNYRISNKNDVPNLNNHLIIDALSSTSSSSSGLSNSSSLNHLNQQQTSVNILRHSEL